MSEQEFERQDQEPETVAPDSGAQEDSVADQQPEDGGGQTPVPTGDDDHAPRAALPPRKPGDPPRNRKERREDWKENQELKKLVEMQARQLEALDRMGDRFDGLTRSIEESRPKPEDPKLTKLKENRKRIDAALARLKDDPSAYEEFQELQDERIRLTTEIAALEVFEKQIRPTLPQPRPEPPAEYKALVRDYPWLEDPEQSHLREAANSRAKFLAKSESRDMKNPRILDKTLREAAAWVVTHYEVKMPGAAPGNPGRVSSPNGRSGAAPAPRSGMPNFNDADIAEAAAAMYPDLPLSKAIAQWKTNVGRHFAR